MWKMQSTRIFWIHIISVSCLFARTQLPLAFAVPLEYINEHEQLAYDFDTEQSEGRYDSRLISEQLHTNNAAWSLKDSDASAKATQQQLPPTEDDLQPHERAASCHSEHRKYAHGEKVPREDPCEVCLCVDGEIFCWWNKCASSAKKWKKPASAETKYSVSARKTAKAWKVDRNLANAFKPKGQKHAGWHTTSEEKELHSRQHSEEQHLEQQIKDEKKRLHFARMHKKKLQHMQKQPLQNQFLHKPTENVKKQKQKKAPHSAQHVPNHELHHTSNKILNFPENLPSVLYYDYKTEEHEHHEHQHHQQQQLKHQRQQQQPRLMQQDLAAGLDESTASMEAFDYGTTMMPLLDTTEFIRATATATADVAANANADVDSVTDSDILPEPPTKKVPRPTLMTAHTLRNGKKPSMAVAKVQEMATTQQMALVNNNQLDKSRSDYKIDSTGSAVRGTETEMEWQLSPSAPTSTKLLQSQSSLSLSSQQNNEHDRHYHGFVNMAEEQYDLQPALSPAASHNRSIEVEDSNDLTQATDFELPSAPLDPYGLSMASSSSATLTPMRHVQSSLTVGLTIGDDDSATKHLNTGNNGMNLKMATTAATATATATSIPLQSTSASTSLSTTAVPVISDSATLASAKLSALIGAVAAAANKQNSSLSNAAASPEPVTSLDRQCNVMGTMYRIGEVLPQETGNCLQCICIDGSTNDDTPRVTCSPHNCPPLVLPDLFESTGY